MQFPSKQHQSEDAAPNGPNRPGMRKAEFWNRLAQKYAATPIADMAGYEASLQRTRSLLSAEHDVLEIGCGTGTTALHLAASCGRFLATDISPEMIAIAQGKLAAHPIPQLSFALADADGPISGAATYDRVLAFNMLHLVSDLDQTLAMLVHALRPGGLLISKTPCIAEMNPLIQYLALPLMCAVGKAPRLIQRLDAARLQAALGRQGLLLESVERHGSNKKDFRVYIVARKPLTTDPLRASTC